MKVCFRKEETIMDKVDAVIVNAKENNRIIETIDLNFHEFAEFSKLLYKLEAISQTTDEIPNYVWYRGVKVINTGWTFDTEDPTDNIWELYLESQKKRELGPDHENYHKLYGKSNKLGSIPVDNDEAIHIHWGKSVLDPENEHRKNLLAREALDKIPAEEYKKLMQGSDTIIEGSDRSKAKKIYMKRVCTSCNYLYQPTMEDDGDTCPGCARY